MIFILLFFIQCGIAFPLFAAELAVQEEKQSTDKIKQSLLEAIKLAGYKPKFNPTSLKNSSLLTLLKTKTSSELYRLPLPSELKDELKKLQSEVKQRACLDNAVKMLALTKESVEPIVLLPLRFIHESHDKRFLATYNDEKTVIYELTNNGPKFYKRVDGRFIKYTPDFRFLMVAKGDQPGFVNVETNESVPLPVTYFT